jgi:hypothetical protein
MFMLPCVQIAALRLADHHPSSTTDYVKDQETEKAVKVQQRAVETWMGG